MKKEPPIKLIAIFCICSLHIIFAFSKVFAGTISYNGDNLMYKLDSGDFAKDSWIWIDTNEDSIAECYRFDSSGYLASNYEDSFGRETNDKGQLIDNGFVIQKMLSNGKIINGEGTPEVAILKSNKNDGLKPNDGYLYVNGKKVYDNLPNIEDADQGDSIITVKIPDGFIGPVAEADNGVIYANGGSGIINSVSSSNGNAINSGVAGKSIKKYIATKNKCYLDTEKVIVYNGEMWDSPIELRGDGAFIKINLKGNNYIYFEVANELHAVDEKDVNLSLDMYVDGELYDSIDEFVDGESLKYSEEFYEGEKLIELRVHITGGSYNRKVYLKNAVLRKVKQEDD